MGMLYKLVCNKTGYYNIFATYESELSKCMERLLSWYNYMDTNEGIENLLLGIIDYEPFFYLIKLGDYKLEKICDFENSDCDMEELEKMVKEEIKNKLKCINRLDCRDMEHFEDSINEKIKN